MAGETPISIVGRIATDPEIRFTESGEGVVRFRVAVGARAYDRQANAWKDKPATFWWCSAWDNGKMTLAQNIANVAKKGDEVIVSGIIETRQYEKDGQTRDATQIRAEYVGKSLRWHSDSATQNAPGAWNPPATSSGPPAADGSWTPASTPAAPQNDTWGGWGNSA